MRLRVKTDLNLNIQSRLKWLSTKYHLFHFHFARRLLHIIYFRVEIEEGKEKESWKRIYGYSNSRRNMAALRMPMRMRISVFVTHTRESFSRLLFPLLFLPFNRCNVVFHWTSHSSF